MTIHNTKKSANSETTITGMRIPIAAGGINAAEKAAGVRIEVDLVNNAAVGDIIELLINGRGFTKTVKHVVTAANITAGKAALTIDSNAGWGNNGAKELSAHIKDVAHNIDSVIGNMTVTLDTVAPTVNNTLTVLAASGGIDAAERSAGVTVTAYLPKGTMTGDAIELLIDGAAFAKPVTHVVTAAELAVHKVALTIVGNDTAWGADGSKVLSARIIDAAGNIGIAGGIRTVKLNTNTTTVQESSLTIAAAANSISAAEKAAGVAIVMDLVGTNAVAGGTIELLLNGRAFAKPVIHTLTSADIASGKTTLTIGSVAGWGDDGSKKLSAQVKDVTGKVVAVGGQTIVTLDTTAPTVTNILSIAAAADGINATEKAAGVAVIAYLPTGTVIGDSIEVLIGGASFATPLTHVLTSTDISTRKVTLTIPGNDAGWGADGTKILSARIIDAAGNAGKAGGSRTIKLDTDTPAVQTNALTVATASNGINAAEKTAGIAVVMDLTGANAIAGDTAELLVNGVAFATPVTRVLSAADITAQTITFTIASTAGWGADGSKTLSARIKDQAGNIGAAGGNLTFTLDTTAPTAPANGLTSTAAASGINATEKTAGVNVTADLTGTNAAVGDTIEILLGGAAFTTPVIHVLTSGEVTAGSVTMTIPSTAGWGTDGSKTLTMRIIDVAGNVGTAGGSLITTLDTVAPTASTAVTVTPVGGTIAANTLNNSNTHMTAQAIITAGQATGGSAVLKVGGVAVATDTSILASDTTVTFSTSDGTPTNAELQAAVAAGGIITVTLIDTAGNETTSTVANPTLTVNYSGATAPTAVTMTPVGGVIVADTLNGTNTHLTAQATIVAGEATGGIATLKVGGVTIATDSTILSNDTIVTFTTSDGSPTNVELQAAIAASGLVTVTLTDTSGNTSTSTVGNPTLIVDYIAPGTPTNPISVTAGDISAAEKAAGVAVGIDLAGIGAIAGDTVELLISGAAFTTPVTHVLTNAEATAGNVLLTVAADDNAWSLNGSKALTVRVSDAAGNIGTAGGNLTLVLDTETPEAATVNPILYSDEDGDLMISEGDIFILAFSEATDETFDIDNLTVNNAHTFGAGATAIWNAGGTELILTLGTGTDVTMGDIITIVGVADVAGNTANIDFTV